ncbi:glutamyl-tRNA reductase [Pararhodospirillum photometricum]|uniref:Glutamyl-tRNA reductase n=1 Tax=Pararhodospirillum photometricum DSM 122 TaxID=1150469 RepID=H6SJY8_PARPM|nr:glutamyl-tRNA reductase [Pararhodospirillum photometricum]CCG08303.1 Glutamyl-tRNA reductase [Pararhodospirillum photometricum DSM 122]
MSEGPGIGVEGYLMVGVNQKVTPLALRDRLSLDDPSVLTLLTRLRQRGLTDVMALSTCDRVEICAHSTEPAVVRQIVLEELCAAGGLCPECLEGHLLDVRGASAVSHLFRVAASLESQVIGEPHVLGQVKAAHRLARDAGIAGSALEALLQAAYTTAKRARAETPLAEGPVSLAAAAVQVARDLHGDLGSCRLLLLGTQEMGELIAEQLLAAGVGRLVVCSPRRLRAQAVAERLGGLVATHDRLMDLLVEADIVVAGMGGSAHALSEEAVRLSLRRRRNRPIFLVDVAVPATIEPAVERLEAAFLYDLADLEGVAERGRANRDEAARAASLLVDEAVRVFVRHRAERRAVPAIMALRALFDVERRRALDEAPDDAEKATRLLVGRLLHAPSAALRAMAAESEDAKDQAEAMLRRLFALPGEEDGPEP